MLSSHSHTRPSWFSNSQLYMINMNDLSIHTALFILSSLEKISNRLESNNDDANNVSKTYLNSFHTHSKSVRKICSLLYLYLVCENLYR